MPPSNNSRIAGYRHRINTWIQRLLKGTYHHFLFILPTRNGIAPWLLKRFFAGIRADGEQLDILRNLPKDAVVVYTIKYRSYFEYLFFHTRYRQEELRVPELGFGYRFWLLQPVSRLLRNWLAHLHWLVTKGERLDPFRCGFWRQALTEGQTALLPLVEKNEFYKRFVKDKTDPLLFLIELQKEINRPVFLVPHLMFFSKSPAKSIPALRDVVFGTKQHPGKLRRLATLFRQPSRIFVEVSQPISLQQFIEQPDNLSHSPEYQALSLRRQLLRQHNRHRQSITGPVLKTHEELKQGILSGKRLNQFMAHHAASRKEPLHAIRKKADGYLDEIAAKYNFFFVNCMARIAAWIFKAMFEGTVVDQKGLQRVKTMSQKGPLILIPCHKSHIDYLILSYILYQNDMPCPHIAAGKNLSFWPMGPIFRAGGAFFLRRTFRGAVLYSKVFSEYIHKLLAEGFNIEIFIEGGRSRTGKLLMPKLGFLSILLNAYKNGACDDMIFAPVFIGYDQVLEEKAYLHEIEGGKKEPENLSQVIRARKFLKKRYGKIYINFNEPISLNDLLQRYDTDLTDMPTKEQNALCRDLGWRVINAIDQASMVTPHALVAAAILNCPQKRFRIDSILSIVETYYHLLVAQNAHLTDTLAIDYQRACQQALDTYVQRKFIEKEDGSKKKPIEQATFVLNVSKRPNLEYYKNNCIAYFVPAALTAISILEKDAFQFSANDLHDRYNYLQDFFKYEFAFDIDRPPEFFVRKSIKSFIDHAVLMPHRTLPDTYQITSAGLRELKLYAGFLKTYFESYWVVLHYYEKYKKNALNKKDQIKKIQSIGKSMLKRHEIELPESQSKINYTNAISFFTTHGVKGADDQAAIEQYKVVISGFRRILKR